MMRRLLAALLLMLPVAAWADPLSIIVAAIYYIGAAQGLAAIVYVVGSLYQADRARKKANAARNASLRDRVVTVRGATEYRRIILGRQPAGGVVAFHGSVGQYKEQFVMVVAVAAHEVDAIEEIWLNDTKLILGGVGGEYVQNEPYAKTEILSTAESLGDGATTVFTLAKAPIVGSLTAVYGIGEESSVLACSFSGTTLTFAVAPPAGTNVSYQYSSIVSYVRVRKFLGAPGQTVDTVVSSLFPGEWDSTHPMSGCAGFAIHFYYSEDVFISGLPNAMTVCRGAKCYDVRKDSTAGGSGAHRANDPNTWEWTENVPLLINYLATSPLGGRMPIANVSQTHVAAAAEVCDTLVDYSNWAHLVDENGLLITTEDGDVILAGATGTEEDPLYTAGLIYYCNQRPIDAIAELCEAMAGKYDFIGNVLVMKAGNYTAPVLSLGDDDFAGGPVPVTTKIPREYKYNEVSAKILDRAQDWREVPMPRVVSSAYVAQDNGEKLPLTGIDYQAITRVEQAQQVSAVRMRESRQALTFTARFKLTALPLQIFDTFSLTNAKRGWAAKPFEVVGRSWSLDGLVEITGRETDPTIYAFGDVFDAVDAAPNTTLPLVRTVEQPTVLGVESGTSELTDGSIITRVQVSWVPTSDQSILQNGRVELQYIDANTFLLPSDWPGQQEQGGADRSVVLGLRGGRVYLFRVRFIGASGRVRGPWSTVVAHTVASPPSIGGQNMFVNPSFELDTANVADNWTPYSNGTVGSVSHSDAAGVFGSRSQRIDLTNLGTGVGDQAGYWQGVNVSGFVNKQMTLSVYAEGTANAKIRLYADWYNVPGGTIVSSSSGLHTLTTTIQRFNDTFLVPTGCTHAQLYFWIEQRPSAPGAAFMELDAAQFEPGASATAFTATADEALATAAAAEATANAAAASAATAIAQLTALANDNILSPVEKPMVVQDYNVLISEQAGIDAQATAFAITTEKTAYDAAVAALVAYLAGLTGWNVIPGSDVTIVGTTWRSTWSAVYTSRQALLNRISTEAALRANWINVAGRPTTFRAIAKGYNANALGNGPSLGVGLFNADTGANLASPGRSYLFVRIRRSDRVITASATYDVYLSTANATALAAALDATDVNHIAVVITYDEPAANRTAGLIAAMKRCGASVGVFVSPNFKVRSAYILIGIGGCGEGNGAEFYQGSVDDDPQAWTDASFMITNDGSLLVTGSSAIPRTLTDYGAGGLAYLGTVDTAQINSGAVTDYTVEGDSFQGQSWTNSASNFNPQGTWPSVSFTLPADVDATHAPRQSYQLDISVNTDLRANSTSVASIKCDVRLVYRDMTTLGSATSLQFLTVHQPTFVPAGLSSQRHVKVQVSMTARIPFSAGLVDGHSYQFGLYFSDIAAYDATGAQIAPGASSDVNLGGHARLLVVKA